MTFDEVADELYGLDPSDFVAARTDRQKQARSDGDKALAKQIGALRKPTIVGWVLNVTVRDADDDVADLLDLGEALREAQQHLSGATLRTLTKQRQRAVRALANRAAEIAEDRGHPIGEDVVREVTQSLNAALSDADIADEVRRGRMLGAAEYSGFGPMGLVSVDPEPAEDPEPAKEPEPDDTAEREKDEQRARAQAELDDAEAALQDATDALDKADHRVDELQESVDALTEQLEKARQELKAAQDAHSEAASEKDATTARVRNATKRLDRL
ncbi:hypothetical protein ASG56_06695 [Rhodococcus sp. Leaf7]|uniref:hypothetical protein n=1 Tax=unclassified Rhodococcus (in: high G+C Gram-positive bacteria) TaxID=192944 RepID=UPI0006F863A8|nr:MULTISPECIES: hypothetical protein [unclassified Rhodococcus (in: high G+C Gram-positive bacteria)]KQU07218.1 hypothetical protein ASG56_06695 [Rhodococcus sp. Leaf7]KQU42736.1 hypothetical protein ASG64_06695 [Rhodococcus sp. Leaf247]